jgi:membrane associated rhomboid family serine protease
MRRLSPVTASLLLLLAAGFALQRAFADPWVVAFALWPLDAASLIPSPQGPLSVHFSPWQLVTYSFLHGGILHLAVNGVALWMFGPPIERLLGPGPFAFYWFACVVGAAVAQLLTLRWTVDGGALVPTIGASGGAFGVLLAFGMFYPRERILLLIPPIPMPAWLFVILYAALELYLGVTRDASGVAHFAHLGGMLAGFALIQYWRGRLPIRPRRILMR